LNYTRRIKIMVVEGGGFEPPKAEPADLQSDPFGRSGTPPILGKLIIIFYQLIAVNFLFSRTYRLLVIYLLSLSNSEK
jgi:hypothetical protein